MARSLDSNLPSMFEFTPITEQDLDYALLQSSKNCSGSDHITNQMLRLSYPTIRPYLIELFNRSLEIGCFPDDWKLSVTTPLSKIHPPVTPPDTHPIALLPVFSKLLERIVHKQLLSYLTQQNLIDPHQSGFRPFHSTQSALLGFTEEVRAAMERGEVTPTLLFDFSKAFDTVSHALLLSKITRPELLCQRYSLVR